VLKRQNPLTTVEGALGTTGLGSAASTVEQLVEGPGVGLLKRQNPLTTVEGALGTTGLGSAASTVEQLVKGAGTGLLKRQNPLTTVEGALGTTGLGSAASTVEQLVEGSGTGFLKRQNLIQGGPASALKRQDTAVRCSALLSAVGILIFYLLVERILLSSVKSLTEVEGIVGPALSGVEALAGQVSGTIGSWKHLY